MEKFQIFQSLADDAILTMGNGQQIFEMDNKKGRKEQRSEIHSQFLQLGKKLCYFQGKNKP